MECSQPASHAWNSKTEPKSPPEFPGRGGVNHPPPRAKKIYCCLEPLFLFSINCLLKCVNQIKQFCNKNSGDLMLQTLSHCHIQSVSVTDVLCLSQTVCVCHKNLCLCLSQTVFICHRNYLSVTELLCLCLWQGWQATHETWHVTCDSWHVTHGEHSFKRWPL